MLDTVLTISILSSLIVALGMYLVFVPRNDAVISVTDEEDTSESRFLKRLSNEVYNTLPLGVEPGAKEDVKIANLLRNSGNPWNISTVEFRTIQIGLLVVGAILGLLLSLVINQFTTKIPWYVVVALLAFVGYNFPKSRHKDIAKQRDLDFKRELPEALDLIIISISGGLTLEKSIREAIPNMTDGVLKDEFTDMVRQLDSGRTIDDALRLFGERSPNEGIKTFVQAVREATTLAVPMSEVLESRAEASREEYFAMIGNKTASLDQKMMIVLMPTLLPALMIVILSPSLSTFSNL